MYVGKPVKRVEDLRLITGSAKYLDDMVLPRMLYAYFVRSVYAHAKITEIDVSKAMLPGIVAIFTGRDLKDHCGPLAVESVYKGSKVPVHYPLAVDEVKYVGEPVAVIVGEDRYVVRDAADEVSVSYQQLPSVTDPMEALSSNSPLVHSEFSDNVCFRRSIKRGEVEALFNNSSKRVGIKVKIQRLAPSAMEPRGVLAEYDRGSERLTVWASTQFPHKLRTWISTSLKCPESSVRVITPEVGGGFGSKLSHYPEDVVIPYLAMRIGRPVKWFEERGENLRSTTHGRDMIAEVEAAVDENLRVTALRGRIIADLGAYNHTHTQDNPILAANMLTGTYAIGAVDLEVIGVFTNKMATDAYRGAGRPEGSYIIERLMDRIARTLNVDPAELRMRNFIPPQSFPYRTPLGFVYDSGNYEGALRRALELVNYEDVKRLKSTVRDRYIGVGISTFVEVCNFGYQSSYVKVEPSGLISVYTSTSPHGQGEETAFSQIVADRLGVSMEKIRVIHGDTDTIPYGSGTAGSWTLTSGGMAIINAVERIREKMLRIAASRLEARVEDLEMNDGRIYVKGTHDKYVTFEEVASIAYDQRKLPGGLEMGLTATGFYRPELTFPFGAYIAVVSVDPETYQVTLERVVMVSDCGKVVNPMLVDGQIAGGAVQALGQALYEDFVYDKDGNPLSVSFADYLLPSATEVPEFILDRTETPANNPLGTKGVGELSTIGLAQAIVNAVEDALWKMGAEIVETPVTPQRLYGVLRRRGA
ncbi:MAG: xanthine dehydrogenase family protein molybdopterin-binding subunit [Aigarchaeota archaeon]|nr:xanthine dehydrogenase family protein molybdopterin-binding subunit [Aigarchaeota archaeon]MDW8092989.1 xanthine dehydrogenase family protein molybdopterin-binding subunit [Nitrososphaerota archaeon]